MTGGLASGPAPVATFTSDPNDAYVATRLANGDPASALGLGALAGPRGDALHPSQRLTHGEKLEWQRVRHELPEPILLGIDLMRSVALEVCDTTEAKQSATQECSSCDLDRRELDKSSGLFPMHDTR